MSRAKEIRRWCWWSFVTLTAPLWWPVLAFIRWRYVRVVAFNAKTCEMSIVLKRKSVFRAEHDMKVEEYEMLREEGRQRDAARRAESLI